MKLTFTYHDLMVIALLGADFWQEAMGRKKEGKLFRTVSMCLKNYPTENV